MLDYIRQNAQSWGVKVIFGLIILVFVFWGVGSFRGDKASILAYVNEEPILIQDFSQSYRRALENLRRQQPNMSDEDLKRLGFRQQVFSQMVVDLLVREEAERLGLTVSPPEVFAQIRDMAVFQNEEQDFDREVYKEVLRREGMRPAEFEYEVRKEMLRGKLRSYAALPVQATEAEARDIFDFSREQATIEYLPFTWRDFKDQVELADAEIEAFYQENIDRFQVPPRVRLDYLMFTPTALARPENVADEDVKAFYEANLDTYFTQEERVLARHILIKADENASEEEVLAAKKRILEIAVKAQQGQDFAELAQEYSEGPSSVNGGDLGWFSRGQMVESFENVAFDLAPGRVSEPVRTMFGWHLIKVIDHEEAHRKPLVEVEDTIRSMLAEEKAQDRVNNALDQALEMILSGESLESIAEALNLRVKDSGLFSRNQGGSLLGLDQDSLESVFAMAQGEISDRPLSVDQGYMLATVTEKKDAASRPLDEVREQVVEQLTRNKGAELAKEKAAAVAEQMREERGLPEDYRDALETSDPFGRQGSIPGLGMNPELVTAAFGVNPGDWILKPFQVSNGYVLARVLERTPPEDARWQEERDMWLGFLRQQKEREVFQSYLQTLQQQAEIRLVNAQALEQ